MVRTLNMDDEKATRYQDVEREAVRRGSGAPKKVLKHSNDADDAMKAFEGHDGEILVVDEATNKRLLRKIDLNIIPVLSHMDSFEALLMSYSSCVSSMASITLTVRRPARQNASRWKSSIILYCPKINALPLALAQVYDMFPSPIRQSQLVYVGAASAIHTPSQRSTFHSSCYQPSTWKPPTLSSYQKRFPSHSSAL